MRAVSAGFLADYFVSWMGGASLLASLIHCVARAAPSQGVRVEVLMHARALGNAAPEPDAPFVVIPAAAINASGPLDCLLRGAPIEQIVFYRDLAQTLRSRNIRVLGPTGENLGRDFPVPWLGYLPDFQHQYLDRFFSQQDRIARDGQFRAIVENSAGLYVNSGTVAADVERFYPGAARGRKILRLPLVLPRLDAIEDPGTAARSYGLERPFFLSCSQRWLHKQHDLILRAFAQLIEARPSLPLDLVFTGEVGDHRDPGHAARVDALIQSLGIAGRVRVLGLIPRSHQLALMRLSLGVVQASLFEGGPGASGTMEAALLGTPVIASDIAANRELPFGRVRYFPADSAEALSHALSATVDDVARNPDGDGPAFDAPSRELLEMASGLQMIAALRSFAQGGAEPAAGP